MPTYIALLRAVNVGGTGLLPMATLKAMCASSGFTEVRTYIASGNVVFLTTQTASQAKAALECRLRTYAGKPVGVIIRTPDEMADILSANPFPEAIPKSTMVVFLDDPPPDDALDHVQGRGDEALHLGKREIYIAYRAGIGRSRLRIPAAEKGTARNLNTITKLIELAAATASRFPPQ